MYVLNAFLHVFFAYLFFSFIKGHFVNGLSHCITDLEHYHLLEKSFDSCKHLRSHVSTWSYNRPMTIVFYFVNCMMSVSVYSESHLRNSSNFFRNNHILRHSLEGPCGNLWSQWSKWSRCITMLGRRRERRQRFCIDEDLSRCLGNGGRRVQKRERACGSGRTQGNL